VGEDIFALNIGAVREVLELTPITRVPRTPKHMRGVLNLRGHAVPVVDMRLKLGMERGQETVDSCIIIVELVEGEETIVIGALVDAVQEVYEISDDSITDVPNMGLALEADYIQGIGRQGDNFIILLDISKIFSMEELAVAHNIVADTSILSAAE
jgi:purine-binding chemotaxis protein CheW